MNLLQNVPSFLTESSTLLVMSATTAALGGLLFGYDVGIISTALPQIQAHFGLDCFQQEMVVSFMLIGALVASLAGGGVSFPYVR